MKSTSKLWIWITFLLLLFMVGSYFSFTPKPDEYPNYVTDSPAPMGTKAFYTYLKQEMDVTVWQNAPSNLPDGTGKLLIMIEPSLELTQEEIQKYTTFMKKGNTILLFAANPNQLFDLKANLHNGTVAGPLSNGSNNGVKAKIQSNYRLDANHEDKILFQDPKGTVALKRGVGHGQLIAAVTPEWLTNENILKLEHLPSVLELFNAANPHAILFDEYIHGSNSSANYLTVYPNWFLLFLLQGVLIMFLWLWYKGKRFGPIFQPREELVRFSDEGIQALSAWYLRGKLYHDSFLIQVDYLKQLIQENWHISYQKEWTEIEEELSKKVVHLPIREFLSGLVKMIERKKMTKQEYIIWSNKLEQLRKEVEA